VEPVATRFEEDLTSVSIGIDEDRFIFTLFELRHVSVVEEDGEHAYLALTRWRLSVPVPPAGDELRSATADYLASVIVDSTWEPLTRWWSVDDPLGADAAASWVEEVNNAIHDGVVSTPITATAEALGVPDLAASILAGVVDNLIELPQEGLVSEVGEIVRIAGIGFGLATGNHLLAIASFKSLVQDVATERLAELIEGVLTPDQRGAAGRDSLTVISLSSDELAEICSCHTPPELPTPADRQEPVAQPEANSLPDPKDPELFSEQARLEEQISQAFQQIEEEKEVSRRDDWLARPEDASELTRDPAEIEPPELDFGWP
jgi:hypothetical protein